MYLRALLCVVDSWGVPLLCGEGDASLCVVDSFAMLWGYLYYVWWIALLYGEDSFAI